MLLKKLTVEIGKEMNTGKGGSDDRWQREKKRWTRL